MRKKVIISIFKIYLFLFASQFLGYAQYNWNNLPLGAGGFVTGIVYSKTEANLKYARTDVGGAYRWDQTKNQWIPLLDWVSTDETGYLGVESIAIDPNNNNNVYMSVGTDYFNSGKSAILKSTDRGNTFTVIDVTSQFKVHGNGMGRQNGERLAIDPNNSNIIYCGSRRNGLFKSTNGGTTWSNVASLNVTTTANDNGICFVLFDASNVVNNVTQTIYVGVSRTGSTNLYKSVDGGSTWNAVSNATTTYMPQRAVLASDKNLYVTYADKEGPWNIGSGQVSKLNTTNGTWTNITPNNNAYGYGGIDVDPTNPQRIILSTSNKYNLQYNAPSGSVWGDVFYLSTNGGSSWTDLVGASYITINTNGMAWMAGTSIHWTGDIKFDPFSLSNVSVISGQGIFTCSNVNTYPTTWKADAMGIEETVPLDIVSIPNGPVVTALGDVDGFINSSALTFGTRHTPSIGTTTGISYASGNTQKLVRVGDKMYVSTNQGSSWTQTATISGVKGKVALSYDGNTILHCPEGSSTTYRSTNNGTSWSISNGISIKDAVLVADPITNNKFYAYNDANGALLVSTDGGINFTTASTTNAYASKLIRTVPGFANHLWLPQYWNGLKRSIDGGSTLSTPSSNVTWCTAVGFGMAKAGSNYPTLYIWGTVSGVTGLFTSIDQGVTWTRINDDAHEFGGTGNGQFVIGDMNVYGRVYMSTVGRGVITGIPNVTTPILTTSHTISSAGVKTYPNPVKDILTLDFSELNNLSDIHQIEIYNIQGYKISDVPLNNLSNNNQIVRFNVQSLPLKKNEIYLIKIQKSDGETFTTKFILE